MSNEISKNLFEEYRFQDSKLNNRIVMAPMTRSRAINNLPNSLIAKYYAQRASAGLIITEGIAPSPEGIGYSRTPGIYSKEQIDGWKEVTNAVHAQGAKIFAQLMHVGRISHPHNTVNNSKIIAPSAIAANGSMWTDQEGLLPFPQPVAITTEEVREVIASFAQAAQNAIEAGFDGIELHGANGYLIEQFLNPNTNTRTDEYGGSIENRVCFVTELAKAVVEAIGADKTAIRLSPYNPYNDMPAYPEVYETYTLLIKELNKLDLVYVHLIDYAARQSDEGLKLLSDIRRGFTNTLILNGGYNTERAQAAIDNNEADLISFGSPFVSNPDLPYRMKHNIPLTAPDTNLFFSASAEGFTDYATAEPVTA